MHYDCCLNDLKIRINGNVYKLALILLAASTLDETVGFPDRGVIHKARICSVTGLQRLHLLLLMS